MYMYRFIYIHTQNIYVVTGNIFRGATSKTQVSITLRHFNLFTKIHQVAGFLPELSTTLTQTWQAKYKL